MDEVKVVEEEQFNETELTFDDLVGSKIEREHRDSITKNLKLDEDMIVKLLDEKGVNSIPITMMKGVFNITPAKGKNWASHFIKVCNERLKKLHFGQGKIRILDKTTGKEKYYGRAILIYKKEYNELKEKQYKQKEIYKEPLIAKPLPFVINKPMGSDIKSRKH